MGTGETEADEVKKKTGRNHQRSTTFVGNSLAEDEEVDE